MNSIFRSTGINILITTVLLSFKIINSIELNNTNLVLYINCNNIIQDSSESKISIENHGVTFSSDRIYDSKQACYFDGNSYLKGSSNLLPTGSRTVSFWFYLEQGEYETMFSYGGDTCGTSFMMTIDKATSSYPQFPILEAQSGCNTNTADFSLNYSFMTYTWYHWTVTTGETGTKMYINGQPVASNLNYIKSTYVNGKDFSVGVATDPKTGMAPYTNSTSNLDYFKGGLDEIRIYNINYSDAEVLDLFNQEVKQPPCWDSNCQSCPDYVNICQSCITGYTVYFGMCIPSQNCGSNCTACSGNVCTQCQTGYTLQSGQCVLTCTDINCQICSNNPDYCNQCTSGYQNQNGTCAKPCNDSNCNQCYNTNVNGTYYLTNGSCLSSQSFWARINSPQNNCDVSYCQQCSSGNSSNCEVCESDYQIYKGLCATTNCEIATCQVCTPDMNCLQCIEGYQLDTNLFCDNSQNSKVLLGIIFGILIPILVIKIIVCCLCYIRRKRLLAQSEMRVRQARAEQQNEIVIERSPDFSHRDDLNNRSNRSNNQRPFRDPVNIDINKHPKSEEKNEIKIKCVLCNSLMVYGRSSCSCYICYNHCKEIKDTVINKLPQKHVCPVHRINIEDFNQIDEEMEPISTGRNEGGKGFDKQEGKCPICFDGLPEQNFSCGCPVKVCAKCVENYENVYKNNKCPFCRNNFVDVLSLKK